MSGRREILKRPIEIREDFKVTGQIAQAEERQSNAKQTFWHQAKDMVGFYEGMGRGWWRRECIIYYSVQ